jgi:hypothetical protein
MTGMCWSSPRPAGNTPMTRPPSPERMPFTRAGCCTGPSSSVRRALSRFVQSSGRMSGRRVADMGRCMSSGHVELSSVTVWSAVSGVRVAAGRRGRFRLICEGWLPHDGSSLRRGRGLGSSAPAVAGAHSHIADPVGAAPTATPTSNVLSATVSRVVGRSPRQSMRAHARRRLRRSCASWRGPRRGAPSGDAAAAARATQRRSRREAGRPGGA